MIDWARYIGIPYKYLGRDHSGCDCYGTVYLILREQFGLDVPSYTENRSPKENRIESASIINGEIKTCWRKVDPGAESPGDVVLFRLHNLPLHCGVVMGDGRFIHNLAGCNSVVESYVNIKWASRVLGFYRYAA